MWVCLGNITEILYNELLESKQNVCVQSDSKTLHYLNAAFKKKIT